MFTSLQDVRCCSAHYHLTLITLQTYLYMHLLYTLVTGSCVATFCLLFLFTVVFRLNWFTAALGFFWPCVSSLPPSGGWFSRPDLMSGFTSSVTGCSCSWGRCPPTWTSPWPAWACPLYASPVPPGYFFSFSTVILGTLDTLYF